MAITHLLTQFNKLNMTEYQQLSINKLGQSITEGKWDNEGLVQLIEQAGSFLNLMTIPDYAKNNNLSYNGVKRFRKVVNLFGVKFVVDND